ncbi:glycosyltransferase family 2 protein [Salinimonas lutimaris]|uniref:glycosyltransferase family 2 protein n=1 Tax=Salinimonas lutimaris TaxID=914153 RepID=UPI0010C104C3|nr:glycosyltransferase family A protein [Salinimonas lutimaris]
MNDFTLITLVKGRAKQLANLLEAATASNPTPSEIIVVIMDDASIDYTEINHISVRCIRLNEPVLALAKARNMGAQTASSENLVFLDVDCICSPTLFANLLSRLTRNNIVSARARYLDHVPEHGKYQELAIQAVEHPKRASLPVDTPVQWKHFWSLVFAMKRNHFFSIGGFDSNFSGYGAEDTDFAYRHDQAEGRLVFCNDEVLHQYHTKYSPPINYLTDIIHNAEVFFRKHGVFPMYGWLKQFSEMGLIVIDTKTGTIRLRRHPTNQDFENCFSKSVY